MSAIDPDETQTVFRPIHQDRRSMPRVEIECSGMALLPDGKVIDVIIHDVSRDGLQIRCSKVEAQSINPSGEAIQDNENAPEIQVQFDVPLESGPGRVMAQGKLMYFCLIAPDIAAFGMRFKSISSEGVSNLRTVVRAALEPF
jgi:hypothetical protein